MPFSNVIYHKNAIKILSSSLKNNTVAHSYLFAGPNGIGKKLLAIEFAKALNCLNKKDDSCTECLSCKKIAENNHTDVRIISTKDDNIKIEIIREIGKDVVLKPFEGRKKVYIIDDAEKMMQESSNAFLKTLEEPPPNVVFILITSNLKRILSTIISRCQIVRFTLIDEESIKKYIETNFNVDHHRTEIIARLVDGKIGMIRDLIENKVNSGREQILDFLCRLPEISYLELMAFSDLYCLDRTKIEYFLDICLAWFKDILLIKMKRSETITNLDYRNKLENLVKCYTSREILKINESIERIMYYIKRNVNIRLALEVLLLEIKENSKT
ncbi:MAG: DNA polymerase III subunit delta' [Candidatus Firestonebacteria bacterium]|nr:DNA polymerase III subunit delta' [Candidatus Firestonebacteria bacterium]